MLWRMAACLALRKGKERAGQGLPMGCSMSEHQYELLVRYFRRVVLMLDGDEAGQAAKQELSNRLLYSHWIRAVSLAQGIQQAQLSTEELRLAIGTM